MGDIQMIYCFDSYVVNISSPMFIIIHYVGRFILTCYRNRNID